MSSALFELAFGLAASGPDDDAPGMGSRDRTIPIAAPLELSDDRLVARIRAGDAEAFDVLVRRYHRRLLGAARSALDDAKDAEDIVQDVLLNTWINRSTWSPTSGAAVYFFGAVANRARNVWRNRARARQRMTPLDEAMRASESAAIDIAEVWAVVEQLPERWRTAVVLRYVRDFNFADVARTMGISENAAKKMMRRALDTIADRLGRQ